MGMIGDIIQGVNSLAGTAIAANQANKKRQDARGLKGEGERISAAALANRKDYQVAPEIQQSYDRNLNELSAKSQIQSSMETQAEAGVSNLLGAISRNSTSGAGAIAAAQAAEAQRQAGYQAAATAGAGERTARLNRLDQSAGALAAGKDTAYDINEQQMFEREYNRAQDMIGAGYQGIVDAGDQRAQAFTEGLASTGKIAGNSNWSFRRNR